MFTHKHREFEIGVGHLVRPYIALGHYINAFEDAYYIKILWVTIYWTIIYDNAKVIKKEKNTKDAC